MAGSTSKAEFACGVIRGLGGNLRLPERSAFAREVCSREFMCIDILLHPFVYFDLLTYSGGTFPAFTPANVESFKIYRMTAFNS